MTLPKPFRWEDDAVAGELPGARPVLSSRGGGVSGGAFASLDLGLPSAGGERFSSHRRDAGMIGPRAGVVCRA